MRVTKLVGITAVFITPFSSSNERFLGGARRSGIDSNRVLREILTLSGVLSRAVKLGKLARTTSRHATCISYELWI